MTQPVILSAHTNEMKTLYQYPGDDLRLTVWSEHGNTTISLSRSETLAFLRALPPSLLVKAFGEAIEDTAHPPSGEVTGGGGGAQGPKGPLPGGIWGGWQIQE